MIPTILLVSFLAKGINFWTVRYSQQPTVLVVFQVPRTYSSISYRKKYNIKEIKQKSNPQYISRARTSFSLISKSNLRELKTTSFWYLRELNIFAEDFSIYGISVWFITLGTKKIWRKLVSIPHSTFRKINFLEENFKNV